MAHNPLGNIHISLKLSLHSKTRKVVIFSLTRLVSIIKLNLHKYVQFFILNQTTNDLLIFLILNFMIEYLCAINAFLYFLKLNEIQDEIMSRDSVTVNDESNQIAHFCYIIQ